MVGIGVLKRMLTNSPHPVARLVTGRILMGVVSLAVLSVLIFVGTEVLPGDVVTAVLGRNASPANVHILVQRLHLNESLTARYFAWFGGVLRGNLGLSVAQAAGGASVSVKSLIAGRAVNSLLLAGATMVLLTVISIVLGTLAGIHPGSIPDRAISAVTLGGLALPEFVVGTLLIVVFAQELNWLPGTVVVPPGGSVLSQPSALVLPVATLLVVTVASATRVIRASVSEVIGSDFVQQARLNGYTERRVVFRHALRNSLAPAVQSLAQSAQYLVGGIVVVEYLFNYPGIGAQLVDAVQVRDITTVQAVGLLLGACYILLNILADVLVTLLVPKLRSVS